MSAASSDFQERMVTGIARSPKKLRVNDQIRARKIRLIASDGQQVGVLPLHEARDQAREAGLDLVEVNPNAKPPICKMMDYGKYRYEQSKKEREARQKRKTVTVKEVKFRPKIDTHDYETKKRMVIRFLENGDKVKITLMFRGREVVYRKQGVEMLEQLAEEVSDVGNLERKPKLEGRNITMFLAPKS